MRSAHFIEANVDRVDVDRRVVHATAAGGTAYDLAYDHLVVALGGTTNESLIPGSATALTFKSVSDALVLRNHLLERFERADAAADPAERKRLLTTVMVGGGLVGTELIGELTAFTANVLRYYPNLRDEQIAFHLIEAGPRIMPEIDPTLAYIAADILRRRGADIRVGTPVKAIEPACVHLANESIEADTASAMRPEVLSKVRIKHLLSHTSGLGSYFTEEWDGLSRARFRSVDDWMTLVKRDSLAFEPGTKWSYSNTGMLVLGKVIEVASGEDYFAYVREHVYTPAGMTNSDAYELDRVNHNLAVGYELEETPQGVAYRNNIFMHVIRGGPAGGGYSTVDDLTRFAEALKAGRLVSMASVRLLTTPKPDLNSPAYGFGFIIDEGGKIVGHNGGFPGINSQLDIYVGEPYTFAVMANYGGAAQRVADKARTLVLAGRRLDVAHQVVER